MNVNPPSDQDVAALFSEYADRHPVKASVTVRGDRGAALKLPLIIGNPKQGGTGWGDFLRTGLAVIRQPNDMFDRLALDGVIWPDTKTLTTWLNVWPSLGRKLGALVLEKIGALNTCTVYPKESEAPPAALEKELEKHPRAVWLWLLDPAGPTIEPDPLRWGVVVTPPAAAHWRIFRQQVEAEGADVAKIMRARAEASVPAMAVAGSAGAQEIGILLDRYPGFIGHIVGEVAELTGTTAKAELGNW